MFAVDNLPSCDLGGAALNSGKRVHAYHPILSAVEKTGEHGVRKLALNISQKYNLYLLLLIVYIKKKNTNS